MSAEQFRQHIKRELYRMVSNDNARDKLYELMMQCYREGINSGGDKDER